MKECFRGVLPPAISTICILLLNLTAIICLLWFVLLVTPPSFLRSSENSSLRINLRC